MRTLYGLSQRNKYASLPPIDRAKENTEISLKYKKRPGIKQLLVENNAKEEEIPIEINDIDQQADGLLKWVEELPDELSVSSNGQIGL